MTATHVSKPTYDKCRGRWAIRWLETDDEGNTQRRVNTKSKTRSEAEALRSQLRGEPTRLEGPASGLDAACDEKTIDAELMWYLRQLRVAVEAGDEARVELVAKASRACATLVTAANSNRDIRALKSALEEAEKWRAGLTSAGTHGTRVAAVDAGRDSCTRDLRPIDAVH